MACSDRYMNIYHDEIQFPEGQGRYLEGCSGQISYLRATTNMPEPVRWTWSLDGIYQQGYPILSNTDSLAYTFGEENHEIVISAESSLCSINKTVRTRESNCSNPCLIKCATEVAFIPAGLIYELVDSIGKKYPMGTSYSVKCGGQSKQNAQASEAIKNKILYSAECNRDDFKVTITSVAMNPTCLKVELINSPIKLRLIKVGPINYMFKTNYC